MSSKLCLNILKIFIRIVKIIYKKHVKIVYEILRTHLIKINTIEVQTRIFFLHINVYATYNMNVWR